LAPENTASVLFTVAADQRNPTDLEDFVALIATAAAYLQIERLQKVMVHQAALEMPMRLLVDTYSRFDNEGDESADPDDAKLIAQARINLNQSLSDISALPEFSQAYPVVSPFTSSLRQWLSRPQSQLQVCACIMLGNLARSDAACYEFVHRSAVHKPLISILNSTKDTQILHAVLGFLKNLALPAANKEPLGDADLFGALPRLWDLDTLPQIQYSAVSLARQLVIGNFENIRRLCRRLSDDPDSPAGSHSKLSILISLFARTDAEPTKMEISRLIAAICRVYNTQDRNEETMVKRRKGFFERHPDVARPLGFMVSQNKWPVVRSEGWFVFALMAGTEEGAKCVGDMMHDADVLSALVEVLTGRKVGSPVLEKSPLESGLATSPTEDTRSADMKRKDRENALVLVNGLLKNQGEDMAMLRRTMLEDLLKGGGMLHMSYKEIKEASS
jgi:hypothetical protein